MSKATSGVLEIFPPCVVPNALDFLSDHIEMGWQVIGSEAPTTKSPKEEPKLDRPTILVLGSEGAGIPDEVRACCTSGFVSLAPGRKLHPDVDSLNVSVATALLIQKLKSTVVV